MGDEATQGVFEDILKGATPALRTIAALQKGRVEIVWPRQRIASYGVGPRKMTEHYAYVAMLESHVNLGFYHGASLKDPAGLLEGMGKKLRHVKLRSLADVRRPAVRALLREAIRDRRSPAARGG